ncbi:MAG TPA: hypothetical protein VN914_20780 [Polyangia bacterium]|nr:hypothetical protein [Polyangia bacterium]
MVKYIPYSVVLVTAALGLYLAGRPKPKQAIKTMHILMIVYIIIWAMLCLYVYPESTPIE